jgi:hypothetical protein
VGSRSVFSGVLIALGLCMLRMLCKGESGVGVVPAVPAGLCKTCRDSAPRGTVLS